VIHPDAPTLGALAGPHERAERLAAARWRVRMRSADASTRRRVLDRLTVIVGSEHRGRRLDRVAAELRDLADECDRALQRRLGGGWPLPRDERDR
jgi:hypothetical protein